MSKYVLKVFFFLKRTVQLSPKCPTQHNNSWWAACTLFIAWSHASTSQSSGCLTAIFESGSSSWRQKQRKHAHKHTSLSLLGPSLYLPHFLWHSHSSLPRLHSHVPLYIFCPPDLMFPLIRSSFFSLFRLTLSYAESFGVLELKCSELQKNPQLSLRKLKPSES